MGTTADKLQKILTTKESIRQAIISKGVSVNTNDLFSSYASKIAEIQGLVNNVAFNSIESLKNEWKFHLVSSISKPNYTSTVEAGKNYNDSSWENVSIPHDWSIYNTFNNSSPAAYEGGYLDGGDGWYRRRINITDNSKRVYIYFDGIYKDCAVYINGSKVGDNKWYNPFYFDITEHLSFDGNDILAVFVRNNQPSSRWYSGSGIIRNVYLLTGSKVALGVNDVKINYNNLETELLTGIVNTSVTTKINNISNSSQSAIVRYKISYCGEIINTLTETVTLNTGVNTLTHTVEVPNPKLWDVYQGNLYNLNIDLTIDGESVYTKDITYGYRYFKFDKDMGFFLNGRNLKLKGVCLHHDLGCIGAEVNRSGIERQIRILKDMGCNAVRITHNPASSEFLDVCAKEGILVLEEFFDCWTVAKKNNDFAKDFNNYYQSVIETTVNRGYNNPSIIMWSLGNEIIRVSNYTESQAIEIVTKLINSVKAIDTIRPVTMGDDTPSSNVSLAIMNLLDVVGVNYGSDTEYTSLRENIPDKPIYGSETTSALSSRGDYSTDDTNYKKSSYDDAYVGWGDPAATALKRHMDSSYLAGMFVWTGFDYIGEPTPYNRYPVRSSYFGIIDLAGFPKDIYYMYQSRWNDKPMIHILPNWTHPEGGTVKVWLYSNCYKVKLFLNGTQKGSGSQSGIGNKYQFEFNVQYEEGTLVANGYDKNNNLIAQDVIYTSYTPNKIGLKSDKSIVCKDNTDLIFVECNVLDLNGTICPTADNEITFTCSNGTVIGTDNGCASDVTSSLRNNVRKAYNGKCLAVIKPNGTTNDITVTATANGLATGTVTIKQGNYSAIKSIAVYDFVDANNPPIKPSEPVDITGIILSNSSLSVPSNGTATLTYELIPSNTTQKGVTWSVSPAGIATIDNGVVTPITTGECTIRCESAENSLVYAECSLTVTNAITLVNSITLNKNSLSLFKDDVATLTATVLPSDAEDTSVTWSVNNENVSISPNGLECTITGLAIGTSIITVSANDESGKTATCNVNVARELVATYSLDELSVNGDDSKIVRTEITPFAEEKNNFTIYAECTASTVTPNSTLWHCMNESGGYVGACVYQMLTSDESKTKYMAGSGGAKAETNDDTVVVTDKKMKMAFVYNKNSKASAMYYIYEGETELHAVQLKMTVSDAAHSQPLIIGGYLSASGTLGRAFTGTINTFKYYEQALNEYEINNLMRLSNSTFTGVSRRLKLDASGFNVSDNTWTDSINGTSATIVGTPTIANNKVKFNSTSSFNINSTLPDKYTIRIKLTPDTVVLNKPQNFLCIGNQNYNTSINFYAKLKGSIPAIHVEGLRITVFNNSVGNAEFTSGQPTLKDLTVGTESEFIFSFNKNTGLIRMFLDGELIQDGNCFNWSTITFENKIGNQEGSNRFTGSYTLIEMYDNFVNSYSEFTLMVNNIDSI